MGKGKSENRSWILNVALALLGTGILLLNSCTSPDQTPAGKPEKVLVRVNGEPITYQQVDRRLRSIHGDVALAEEDPSLVQRMTEQAIDAEIRDLLLLQAAKAEGISIEAERLDREVDRTRETMGEENFQRMLRDRGADERQYREFARERLMIGIYQGKLLADVEVEEDVLEEYYEGHSEGIQRPAAVRLFILESRDQALVDAVYARAEGGADFNALAEELRAAGGTASRTRWMPYDPIPEGIRLLVKEASPGDLVRFSDPTGDEYVIKVLEKRKEGSADFAEVRDEVRAKLLQARRQAALDDWYEVQLKTAEIEYVREK